MKKEIVLSTLLLTGSCMAGGSVESPIVETASSEGFSLHEIGFNGGISTIQHDQTNVTGDLEQINPDKTFTTYEIFTTFDGICDDKANRPYLSFSYATNDEFKHQYILAGVNHYYAGEMATLYAGLLVGYGELTWKYNPIGAQDTDFSATGLMGGVQVGAEVPLSASIALNFNLKALAQDYTTTFDPYEGVSSYIDHSYTATALVGLVFKF